jgi:hypothetical protein
LGNTSVNREQLSGVVDPVIELVARKNADYGGSVFKHGLKGIYVRMDDKLERMRRLVWEAADPMVKEESVADLFRDLIGYAALALVHMDRERFIDQPAPPSEPWHDGDY